jgi:hypothetical protein
MSPVDAAKAEQTSGIVFAKTRQPESAWSASAAWM